MTPAAHQLRPPGEPPDESGKTASPCDEFPHGHVDLPYKVEVWNEKSEFVELVVAVSVSPAIGYAAYYAATREYPGRTITLRHKSAVLSRWTGQPH